MTTVAPSPGSLLLLAAAAAAFCYRLCICAGKRERGEAEQAKSRSVLHYCTDDYVICACCYCCCWWCLRVWACSDVHGERWKPVVSAVASASVTVSACTQELLSHAGCFCQCWATSVTPQGLGVPRMAVAASVTCSIPVRAERPLWTVCYKEQRFRGGSKKKSVSSWDDKVLPHAT